MRNPFSRHNSKSRKGPKARSSTSVLGRTVERAFWLSVVVFLLGVVLIIWASQEKGTAATVIANLGTSAIVVGLVGVLYEVLLRGALLAEMLGAIGLREDISSLGVVQIRERHQVSLEELVHDARELTVLPLDPVSWVENEFAIVRRVAQSQPLRVTLLLPAADAPYIQVLAERLGRTAGQLEQSLEDAATGKLGQAWEAEPRHPEAKLSVFRFGGLPANGLILTDRLVAVETGPLLRYGTLDREGYLLIGERSRSPLARWVETQIEREQREENISQVDQRPRMARDGGLAAPHPPAEQAS